MEGMNPEAADLEIEIVRFVDNYQPGIVAAWFVDVAGQRHTIIEKVPYLTSADLDAGSKLPTPRGSSVYGLGSMAGFPRTSAGRDQHGQSLQHRVGRGPIRVRCARDPSPHTCRQPRVIWLSPSQGLPRFLPGECFFNNASNSSCL